MERKLSFKTEFSVNTDKRNLSHCFPPFTSEHVCRFSSDQSQTLPGFVDDIISNLKISASRFELPLSDTYTTCDQERIYRKITNLLFPRHRKIIDLSKKTKLTKQIQLNLCRSKTFSFNWRYKEILATAAKSFEIYNKTETLSQDKQNAQF